VGPGQGYFGRFDLNGCEIRAAATLGFASNVIKLGTHGSMDYSKVGVILLRRSEGWQGTTISLQTLRAPEKARKAYEAALKELRREKPRPSRAARELETAVEVFPDFAAAWTLLGQSRLQLHEPDRAREAFVTAIKVDPNYVKPYLSLGLLELNEERWEEAVELALQVRNLGPELPQAYYILGLARYYEGRLAEAEQELQFLVENGHSRQFPIALLHLGIIHTSQGNVRQAVSEFHFYFEHTPSTQIPDWHLNRVQEQLNQWLAQGLILPEDAILPGQPEND
jgi:Tfp pilus assembly protein PilF